MDIALDCCKCEDRCELSEQSVRRNREMSREKPPGLLRVLQGFKLACEKARPANVKKHRTERGLQRSTKAETCEFTRRQFRLDYFGCLGERKQCETNRDNNM